jgi:hypothetical protein
MAACALGILVPAPAALGQAAIDQYIPSADPTDSGKNAADPRAVNGQPAPGADGSTGKDGKGDRTSAAAAQGGGDSGSSGGGDVPGTDFPLTPAAVAAGVVLALGLLGALVFTAVQRRRRVSESH